jgi:Glycosyl hydrolase family 12
MHKLSDSTFVVGSLFALLGALACSAQPESKNSDDNEGAQPFGMPGSGVSSNLPGSGGSSGQAATQAQGTNSGGTEGLGTPVLSGGAGSTGAVGAAGSAGMSPPLVADVLPQEIPPSYFEFKSWHGSAWTYSDPATTRSAQDYSMLARGTPFCLSGAVAPKADYTGVASIGFNINQAPLGAAPGQEPPKLETVPTGMGVAVNYTKTAGQVLRIQLQSLAGETSEDGRWCAELTEVNGPAFVPYTQFRTRCWFSVANGSTPAQIATSVAYQRQPIAAVVLTVPGDDLDPVPYNVCVSGFADGNSVMDAPAGGSLPAGLLTGTLSGEAARIKVTGKDGNSYIINNNAWGDNSGDGTQQLRFTGNSFEILRQTAGPGANSSPASFPSIYIGANGATTGVNGATTTGSNPLPIQVSAINSLPTTFNHSGPLGDNNATYDVWFAPNANPGQYGTAQAAFLMVWTHRPGGRNPIGNNAGRTGITVAGVQGTWDLWVGPRGGGGPDANLPVLSYVAPGTLRNFSFDLSAFIKDAVSRNVGLSNNMFLTDVFAGFEIWGGGTGLRVDEFSADINP